MGVFETDLDVSHPQLRFDLGLLGHNARDIRRCRGCPEKSIKKYKNKSQDICVRLGRPDRDKNSNKRSGEDLGVSVIEIPEFPDGQLFDGRSLGLWRYPEARYGSALLLSGSYG